MRAVGADASVFAFDQDVRCENIGGGGGETMFRLVGCGGHVDSTLVTNFVATDYYVKLHAGRRGGPMRFAQFCIDNEGMGWVPRKACFYAEPSLDGGPEGNRLSFPGTIYTGALFAGQAVVELADAPGDWGSQDQKPKAVLDVDGVDLMAGEKRKAGCIVLTHTDRWTGAVRQAETHWVNALTRGVIAHDGPGRPGVVSYHDDSAALPDTGTWLQGCHVFRIAGPPDPATGAATFKTYRCTRGGTYGTDHEPKWELVTDGH